MSLKDRTIIIETFRLYRARFGIQSSKDKDWSDAQVATLAHAIQTYFLNIQIGEPPAQTKMDWKAGKEEMLAEYLSKHGTQFPYIPSESLDQHIREFNSILVADFLNKVFATIVMQPSPDAGNLIMKEDDVNNPNIPVTVDPSYQTAVDQIVSNILSRGITARAAAAADIPPELALCYRQLLDIKHFQKTFNGLHDVVLNHYKLAPLEDNMAAREDKTFYVRVNKDNQLEYSVKQPNGIILVKGIIDAEQFADIIEPRTLDEKDFAAAIAPLDPKKYTKKAFFQQFVKKFSAEKLEPFFPKILAIAAARGHVQKSDSYKRGHLSFGKADGKRNQINRLLNKYDEKYHELDNHTVGLLDELPANPEDSHTHFIEKKNKIYLKTNLDESLDFVLIDNNDQNPNPNEVVRGTITTDELPELKCKIVIKQVADMDSAVIDDKTKEPQFEPGVLYHQPNKKDASMHDCCLLTEHGQIYYGQIHAENLRRDITKVNEFFNYKILETRISSVLADRKSKTTGKPFVVPKQKFTRTPVPNPRVGMIIETFATGGSRAISISNQIDLLRRFDGNIFGGTDSVPRPENVSISNTQSIFSTVFSGFLFLMFPIEWIYNWKVYEIKPDWLDWWHQQNSNIKDKREFPWGTVKDTLLGFVYLVLSVTSLFMTIANIGFAYVGLGIFDSGMDLTLYLIERYKVKRDIAINEQKLHRLEAQLRKSVDMRARATEEIKAILEAEFKKDEPNRSLIDDKLKALKYLELAHQQEVLPYKAALIEYAQLKIRAYRSTSTFTLIRQSLRVLISVIGIVGAILSFTPAAPIGFILVASAALLSLLVFCGHTYHRFWMAGNLADLRKGFADKEHDHIINRNTNTADIIKGMSALRQEAKFANRQNLSDDDDPMLYSKEFEASPNGMVKSNSATNLHVLTSMYMRGRNQPPGDNHVDSQDLPSVTATPGV